MNFTQFQMSNKHLNVNETIQFIIKLEKILLI